MIRELQEELAREKQKFKFSNEKLEVDLVKERLELVKYFKDNNLESVLNLDNISYEHLNSYNEHMSKHYYYKAENEIIKEFNKLIKIGRAHV